MKNLSYLSSFFLLLLLLSGCGNNNDNPTPETETATFRVDFAQTGDYQKFIKIISITGGEFKYKGTGEVMPIVLSGDNLNAASFSVEASNVRELEISALTGFSPVEDGPATMTMTFTIYKNGQRLDEKTYTYSEVTDQRTEELLYKAN